MNNIKGFTFYKSYYESLKNLKEKDKKEIINAILEYIFDDKIPNFSGIKRTIWTLIEPNLNSSKRHSNENSGAPLGNQNARKIGENEENEEQFKKQSKNNQKTTSDLYDKDKNKNKDGECIYPHDTHTPIFEYCLFTFSEYDEKDLEKSCKKFFKYYKEKNWQGVNDWQLKVEQWIEGDIEDGKIKIKQEEEYDTRTFFTDEDGRTFKYDSKGGKHYV